jgi:predicted regulator of Ras-like GTPase activity (Roadblock/LC7/MglB family)
VADRRVPIGTAGREAGEAIGLGGPPQPSRAQQVRDILGNLGQLAGVRGGLIVTPDGFVIAADVPPPISEDELAALAATLGRELELGMDHLARGSFRTAFFSTDGGAIFLGGSPIGFVILLGDTGAEPAAVSPALQEAVARLEGFWKVQ